MGFWDQYPDEYREHCRQEWEAAMFDATCDTCGEVDFMSKWTDEGTICPRCEKCQSS